MLQDRHNQVLRALVREYIRSGHPVASRELVDRYRLNVSSATVRTSMVELDDLGYLEQPHTSAGRIPTDQGYRYFVDHLESDFLLSVRDMEEFEGVVETVQAEEFVRRLGRALTHLTGTFTATGVPESDLLYKTGFAEVLEDPELQSVELAQMFGRLTDTIEDRLETVMKARGEEEERVFIGEENPLRDGRFCSMTVSIWRHPAGFEGFVLMIGPRRTNYQKHRAVLKHLRERLLDN